jgi:hypothetical protein
MADVSLVWVVHKYGPVVLSWDQEQAAQDLSPVRVSKQMACEIIPAPAPEHKVHY